MNTARLEASTKQTASAITTLETGESYGSPHVSTSETIQEVAITIESCLFRTVLRTEISQQTLGMKPQHASESTTTHGRQLQERHKFLAAKYITFPGERWASMIFCCSDVQRTVWMPAGK
eukprot:4889672-Amphidinium_carterae.1